jgi:hypothetical protein
MRVKVPEDEQKLNESYFILFFTIQMKITSTSSSEIMLSSHMQSSTSLLYISHLLFVV